MKTLLHIDCSPLGDASISRNLSSEFVKRWTQANPSGTVIRRDLNAGHISAIDGTWVAAVFTPEEVRTPAQRGIVTTSDRLIEELNVADEYVVGLPMHNFGVPAVLKLWLDQIIRVGKTFAIVDGAPVGLLKNKQAQFLIAAGGTYDPRHPAGVVQLCRALSSGDLWLHRSIRHEILNCRWRRGVEARKHRPRQFSETSPRQDRGLV